MGRMGVQIEQASEHKSQALLMYPTFPYYIKVIKWHVLLLARDSHHMLGWSPPPPP